MRKAIFFIIVCLCVGASYGCGNANAMKPEEVVVGNTIPDFSLESLEGASVDKESLKGEVVILNFWASWCSACKSEIPELKEIASKSKARVVGVALDEDGAASVAPFVKSHGIDYTVLLGDQSIFEQFNGVGIPYTLVLDRSQRIVSIYRGPVGRETLEADLKRIEQGT